MQEAAAPQHPYVITTGMNGTQGPNPTRVYKGTFTVRRVVVSTNQWFTITARGGGDDVNAVPIAAYTGARLLRSDNNEPLEENSYTISCDDNALIDERVGEDDQVLTVTFQCNTLTSKIKSPCYIEFTWSEEDGVPPLHTEHLMIISRRTTLKKKKKGTKEEGNGGEGEGEGKEAKRKRAPTPEEQSTPKSHKKKTRKKAAASSFSSEKTRSIEERLAAIEANQLEILDRLFNIEIQRVESAPRFSDLCDGDYGLPVSPRDPFDYM